jgi:Ca-activated chloride channel family protein
MKQIVIIILFLLQGSWLFAQQEKSFVKKGNELYQQQKFTEAEENYRKALAKKQANPEGNFNLGDALYKQKKFEEAGAQFNHLATSSKNKMVAAGAYHNLGNTLMEGKKLEESVEAYKRALLNNPKDEQTRYNLAYAQEKLKKQQDQNKNDKNKNKDKNKDKDKKDKDKNKDNKDNKDKDKKDQDKKDQDKKDQDKQNQQGQKPQVSKEDAQRMLEALNNNEKETQDKLKNKKLKGTPVHISKNW